MEEGEGRYVCDAENRLAIAAGDALSVTSVYDYRSRRIAAGPRQKTRS